MQRDVRVWWLTAWLVAGLILAACQAPPQREAKGASGVAAFPTERFQRAARQGTPVYDLDPSASRLRAYVYRAGAMARQGHNHVIVARDWRGALALTSDQPQAAELALRIPVGELAVDPPMVRRALGGAFGKPLDDSAVAGTRNNLLSPEGLDSGSYPRIGVDLVAVTGELPRPILTLAVTVRATTTKVRVPVAVSQDGDRIEAQGRAILSHEALGLTPFSAAGGALRVADPITIEFRLVGERRGTD